MIAGRIVELRFDVGDHVKRGEVLVRIDERVATQAVAASEAQVSEAVVTANDARMQFERSKALAAQRFISQAALDKAEADYKSAQARVSALLAGAGQAATERGFAICRPALRGSTRAYLRGCVSASARRPDCWSRARRSFDAAS